jgi:hypothetical protein
MWDWKRLWQKVGEVNSTKAYIKNYELSDELERIRKAAAAT